MSRDVKRDQTECKECGKSFDTTEGCWTTLWTGT